MVRLRRDGGPGRILLEADDEKRTIVHHVAEGELFGWMRLMKPAAALLARSERARTLKLEIFRWSRASLKAGVSSFCASRLS